jgi:hypothetical protein
VGLAAFLRLERLAHATIILETPLTMVGDPPADAESETPSAAAASVEGEDATVETSARPQQIDWDAERRRLFQACALAGIA